MTPDRDPRALEERLRGHFERRAAEITPGVLRPARPPQPAPESRRFAWLRMPGRRTAVPLAVGVLTAFGVVGWVVVAPDTGGSDPVPPGHSVTVPPTWPDPVPPTGLRDGKATPGASDTPSPPPVSPTPAPGNPQADTGKPSAAPPKSPQLPDAATNPVPSSQLPPGNARTTTPSTTDPVVGKTPPASPPAKPSAAPDGSPVAPTATAASPSDS